jgi:Fic family protein
LVKAALSHLQFETIHPFLDGNGRVGRLLVTLLLCAEGVLREPLLYLSLYLKQHRAAYYALLDRVRAEGDWEEWLSFFARGVSETAAGAVDTARRLVRRADSDARTIQGIKRLAGSALRVHRALQERPVATAAVLAKVSGVSLPSVNASLAALQEAGIVREMTGRRRNRVFSYAEYLRILTEGTEPIRPG